MKTLIALALLFVALPAVAENQLNIMTGEYEVVPPGYELQFNKLTGDWAYAPPHSQLELNRSTLEFELPGAVRHGGITPAQVMPPLSSYQSRGRISDSTTLRDTQRAVDAIIERQHSGQSAPVYRPRERDDSGQRQLEETRRAVQEFHAQHRLPLKDPSR